MTTVKPITPDEVSDAKVATIPDEVFEEFNSAIARKFTLGRALVYQEDIVLALTARGYTRTEIFGNGWLNVEEAYEAAGWDVYYDKPAYNESYAATFEFKIGKK